MWWTLCIFQKSRIIIKTTSTSLTKLFDGEAILSCLFNYTDAGHTALEIWCPDFDWFMSCWCTGGWILSLWIFYIEVIIFCHIFEGILPYICHIYVPIFRMNWHKANGRVDRQTQEERKKSKKEVNKEIFLWYFYKQKLSFLGI